MSKISIVVPVYYNSDTLMLLYEDMKEKILGKLGDYELFFVDDGSGSRYISANAVMYIMTSNTKIRQSRHNGLLMFLLIVHYQ